MADEALCERILRAYLLALDPLQADAAGAMLAKAGAELADASDDLARELYGFVYGLLSALVMVGFAGATAALDQLRAFDARDNPTAMRRALAAVWESVAA